MLSVVTKIKYKMMCDEKGKEGWTSDLALLWLWRRLAAAALNGPLAWELSYTACAALKRKKKNPDKDEIHHL